MEDPILPGVGSVAAHVKEHRGRAGQGGLGTNEVGSHEVCLFDEPNITPTEGSGGICGQLLNWHTSDHSLYHL